MRRELVDQAHRTLLERRRTLLRQHSGDQAQEQELLEDNPPDWEDRAADVTAARTLASLEERERVELAAVVAALERIDEGSYGRCLGCGRHIEEGRLRAVPEAPLCVHCVDGHARPAH